MLAHINRSDYNVINFEHYNVGSVENLSVTIEGELKDNSTDLHIDFAGEHYHGYKILPKVDNGVTTFLCYVYKPGDREMEVNCHE